MPVASVRHGDARLIAPNVASMASAELFRDDPHAMPVDAGETIFALGDAGEIMYVLVAGEIELRIGERVLDVVRAGGIFGEMALIDRGARSATAVARTPGRLVPIDESRFLYLVQNTPFFALEVMQIMARRLRRMDAVL